GLNGMGKSSVIQALLLLRQSARADLLRAPGAGGGQAGLLLNGELAHLGTAGEALYEGADEGLLGISLEADPAVVAAWVFLAPALAGLVPWLDGPASPPAWPLFGDAFSYLGAERIGPRAVYALSVSQIERREMGADGALAVAFLDAHAEGAVVLPPLRHGAS